METLRIGLMQSDLHTGRVFDPINVYTYDVRHVCILFHFSSKVLKRPAQIIARNGSGSRIQINEQAKMFVLKLKPHGPENYKSFSHIEYDHYHVAFLAMFFKLVTSGFDTAARKGCLRR